MVVVDKIAPNGDSRVSHEYATLNGRRYRKHETSSGVMVMAKQAHTDYLLAVPQGGYYKSTIFLVHGWPDLSFGWRYQIPFLVDQGLRVVVPDQMGYGGTVGIDF